MDKRFSLSDSTQLSDRQCIKKLQYWDNATSETTRIFYKKPRSKAGKPLYKVLGHSASKSHVTLIFFKCRVNLASLNGLPNHCDCAPITSNDLKKQVHNSHAI